MSINKARSFRKNQTEAEQKLWSHLRNRQFEHLKFRRQHSVPPHILDFYCEDKNFCIELDGGQHAEQVAEDQKRTEDLKRKGIHVIRVWNTDVMDNIEGVLEFLRREIHPNLSPSDPADGSHPHAEGGEKKRIKIGEIATTHGVRGLVKIRSLVEDETLLNGDLFTSENGSKTLSIALKNSTNKAWIAQVDGYNDRTAADVLRGTKLYIDRESLPTLNEDEIYYADLIGLSVADQKDKIIGTVIAVENFGASDLLDVKPPTGATFYIPFTDETVIEITDQSIIMDIPEGLLD